MQFWTGYRTDGNGDLVAIDRSDVGYVSARMTTGNIANGCVFGDKMRSIVGTDNFSVDFNTFRATAECEEARPYMCEQSSCTLCDTCVSLMFQNVSKCNTALLCWSQSDFPSSYMSYMCKGHRFKLGVKLLLSPPPLVAELRGGGPCTVSCLGNS